MNKWEEGKQFTWHVDDLKLSHSHEQVVEDSIQDMEKEFGRETCLNLSWGKIHNYLGMVLNFPNWDR